MPSSARGPARGSGKLAAEAALAELELAERLGTVVKVEEATAVMVACIGVIRTKNLALPSRLAAAVPHQVRQTVFDLATNEVYAMLTELSETRLRGTALGVEVEESEAA